MLCLDGRKCGEKKRKEIEFPAITLFGNKLEGKKEEKEGEKRRNFISPLLFTCQKISFQISNGEK